MKLRIRIAAALTMACVVFHSYGAPGPLPVMVDPNYNLVGSFTNLFRTNAALLRSVIGGAAATNVIWPKAGANTTAVTNGLEVEISADVSTSALNLKQNSSTNLDGWASIKTNVLSSLGGSGSTNGLATTNFVTDAVSPLASTAALTAATNAQAAAITNQFYPRNTNPDGFVTTNSPAFSGPITVSGNGTNGSFVFYDSTGTNALFGHNGSYYYGLALGLTGITAAAISSGTISLDRLSNIGTNNLDATTRAMLLAAGGQATNAIGNSGGSGTNTSLYGKTLVSRVALSYSGGTNVLVDCSTGNRFTLLVSTNSYLIFTNVADNADVTVAVAQGTNSVYAVVISPDRVVTNSSVAITSGTNTQALIVGRPDWSGTNLFVTVNTNLNPQFAYGGIEIASATSTNPPGAYAAWIPEFGYSTNSSVATLVESVGYVNWPLTNAGAAGSRPGLNPTGLGGKATLNFSMSSARNLRQDVFSLNQPGEIWAVAKWTNAPSIGFGLVATNGSAPSWQQNSTMGITAGAGLTYRGNFPTNQWFVWRLVYNGASSGIYTNSVANTNGTIGLTNFVGLSLGSLIGVSFGAPLELGALWVNTNVLDAASSSNQYHWATNFFGPMP